MTNGTPGYLTIEGIPVESPQQGYVRLKLTPEGDQFVDVPQDGVGSTDVITSTRAPFYGHEVTQLGIQEGAPITFTSTYAAPSSDALATALDNSDLVAMHAFFPGVGDWFTPGLGTRKYCGYP